MQQEFDRLKSILAEVADLRSAASVLSWDRDTKMPAGGAEARAAIQSTLFRLIHEKSTSDEVGRLLETLAPAVDHLDPDSDDARLLTYAKRDFERNARVPADHIAEQAIASAAATEAWKTARADDDYQTFAPHLERVLDLARRYAEFFEPYDDIYDVFLDRYEWGLTTAEARRIFDATRPEHSALIKAIADANTVDDSCLHGTFAEATQLRVGEEIVTQFGYDFRRGRQDATTHPFAINLGVGDQRITYRVDEEFLGSYLFAIMHESGHAMYEQGISTTLWRTPLYGGTSAAMHESQSRLWENLVGRSRDFWRWYYPKLQGHYPDQLSGVGEDTFYRAINRVRPSLIRVEADEATYNLHTMLRMDIEIELLGGNASVADLPELWRERFKAYLGITPTSDREGVLQDIHWSMGMFGYFITYGLGNLIGAQIWEAARRELPSLGDDIGEGRFAPLFSWLQEKIYRHGSKFRSSELVERITGRPLDGRAYMRYLTEKFGSIYGLQN